MALIERLVGEYRAMGFSQFVAYAPDHVQTQVFERDLAAVIAAHGR